MLRRSLLRWLCALCVMPGLAMLAAELPRSPLLTDAREALAENLNDVAIQKARSFLDRKPKPPEAERNDALGVMGEALLRKGQPHEALEAIEPLAASPDPALAILRGRCQVAVGNLGEALKEFERVGADANTNAKFRLAATIGQADVLGRLGRETQAIDLLRRAIERGDAGDDAALLLARLCLETGALKECRDVLTGIAPQSLFEEKWKSYIEARTLLAEHRPAEALEIFEAMRRDPKGLSQSLVAGATLGIARAQMLLGAQDAAVDVIEEFISAHPDNAWLSVMFETLDRLYASQKPADLEALKQWVNSDRGNRTALALYYLGRGEIRNREADRAISRFERFIIHYPDHPLAADVQLHAARLLVDDGKFGEALGRLSDAIAKTKDPDKRAILQMHAGGVEFRQQHYEQAAVLFREAAGQSPHVCEAALFDAALSSLNAQDYEAFLADYREISSKFPESRLRRELILEEGLLQARTGDKSARDTLQRFVTEFPENRRVPEACLALAEQAWFAGDRDAKATRKYLRVANTQGEGVTADRAACIDIFIKSSDPSVDPGEVIRESQQFIRERPASDLIPDVRMKLGEMYFRTGDFGNARTQFEIIAREFAESPYAEPALYLAGQAAARSMNPDRALELFGEVARRSGPLKLYALLEQAVLKSRLGNDREAVILYDNVLSGSPDPELNYAALAGKGGSLTALGQTDPKYLDQAIEVFDQLAGTPGVPAFWRNQALFRKGKVLQMQGKTAEALTAFYDVLSTPPAGQAETFWFYKVGSEAAQMMEEQKDWKGAIAIYEKMAQLSGPRTAEIRGRLNRLRLEHFIWEE